jgi:hypothetical protein
MLKTLGIVWHFLVHVVVGVIIFCLVAGAAFGVWKFTFWISSLGAPEWIAIICHAVAYLLFAIDVICICFFVLVQGGKLLKEIWEDRGFWL